MTDQPVDTRTWDPGPNECPTCRKLSLPLVDAERAASYRNDGTTYAVCPAGNGYHLVRRTRTRSGRWRDT